MKRWGAAALVLLAAAAVTLALLLSQPSPPRRHPATPPAPRAGAVTFGASVNRLFNDHTYDQRQIDAQLQALHATGATVARSDALWEVAEPVPPTGSVHHFDWSFDDQIVASLAAQGLRWLPILDYSAPWARLHPQLLHSPPASAAPFAAFAAALAARYGSGGAYWRAHPQISALPVTTYEVWNEPDNPGFWEPSPDPAAYADLYMATRAAVAAVDPSAHVIVGGLSRPAAFLPELLHARPRLADSLDGVAIHPYGTTPKVVLVRVRAARAALSEHGLAQVPLYVTEVGWTTHPAGALSYAPESLRPSYVEQTITTLGHTDCGIAAVLLYTWVTPERDTGSREDWYGISPPGGGSSADVAAFAAGVRAGSAPAAQVAVCAS